VEDWFKPHAYSVIMLRRDGYPCVFYGDYYGIPHDNIKGYKKDLDLFMKLRKKYAYGIEHDYFDDTSVVGWTREGDEEHKDSGLAVVMSDSTGGTKKMYIGRQFAGMHFVDAFGNAKYNIKIDENGMGDFYCNRTSVSVWIKKDCK
jgi:alpha-amylase